MYIHKVHINLYHCQGLYTNHIISMYKLNIVDIYTQGTYKSISLSGFIYKSYHHHVYFPCQQGQTGLLDSKPPFYSVLSLITLYILHSKIASYNSIPSLLWSTSPPISFYYNLPTLQGGKRRKQRDKCLQKILTNLQRVC